MSIKKRRSVENIKSNYGRLFVLPWSIGIILFVIIPVIQSVAYSFSKITASVSGINMKFVGISNYAYAWNKDADFLKLSLASFTEILYSLPAIIVISLIIAIILDGNFKGRIIFRTLYFLPVIIATGAVLEWINACINPSLTNAGVSANESVGMIDVGEVMSALGLESTGFVEYFQVAISKIFDLVWASGIQIILFIAGLQSIPDSLYEVSKVEGATKWEEFWFITFPMLSRIIVLVLVFTMVELITAKTNAVMKYIYTLMTTLNYDQSSAMLWIYLLFSSALMGVIILLFKKFCMKKWE